MKASNDTRQELWVKFALSCHLDPEYHYADGWAMEASKYADLMIDEYTKRFGTHLSTDVTEVEKANDDT